MSSSGTARGASKHKVKSSQAPQQTHTQNVNKTDSQTKVQATAEQLRMASIISDKHGEDPELRGKVKQVMDVTGREEEEIIVALHDCDNDTNRAINLLLEGGNDQGEWQETSSKKKKKQPSSNKSDSVIDIKPDKREKSKEREYSDKPDRDNYSRNDRRNRQPPRLARKNREMRENMENERNIRNDSESRDRGGSRGRGHMNGPGRGRGRGRGGFKGNRFDRERERGPQIDTWTNETAANAEKENSNWAEGEEWTADEWTGSLEESKVFTASGVEDSSKVFAGMGDNDAKMFTPPVTVDSFSSTFSSIAAATNGGPALNDTTNTLHTGASLINSISQSPIGTRSSDQLGQKLDLGMLLKKPDQDAAPSQTSQFSTRLDLGMLLQGKPTVDSDTASQQQYLSQLTKSSEALKNAIGIGSSSQTPTPPSVSNSAMASTVGQPPRSSQLNNASPMGSTTQLNKPKSQRTKLPPPSKIPASAVEMPGHIGAFQLDVQFGSLSFGEDSGGFTIGDDKPSNFSTAGSTGSSGLNNHIGHAPKSNVDTPPSSLNSAMTSSVISSAASTASSSVTGLDAISQSLTQSPRPGMYQNSAPTTPSKQEYGQAGLSQSKMTPPDPIPFPSQDRKSSPHYPRASQTSNSINSKSISSPPYSQSGYNTGYSSSGYSQKPVTTASTYSHPSNSLNSSGINSQYANHSSSHPSYPSSSFQNQNSYNSSNQVPSQGSSLYQGAGQGSGSYQGQSGSNYQNQSNSAGYSNQSGSYQNQNSGYHSRDGQSTGSSYQPNISQSGSSYQSGNQSSTSYNTAVTQSSGSSYQRDGQSSQSGYGSHQSYGSSSTGHQNNLQTSSMSSNKLSDSLSKISVKDNSALDPNQHSYDHASGVTSSTNLATSTITTATSLSGGGVNVSSALGLTSATSSAPSTGISSANALSKGALPGVSKAPPNLPPGVPLVTAQNYMIGQIPFFGIAPATAQQPIAYNYEELQSHLLAQQQRGLQMPGYYDMPLQPPTTLTGRDQNPLGNVPYTAGTDGKLNRVDAQSPVQAQTSSQQHTTGSAQQQQAFINPAAATLPPGYNYYTYPGSIMPGYQYSPAVFPVGNIQVPAVTQTHAGTTGATQFQKPGITGNYATHTYATGYDDLNSQGQDFNKYGTASSQNSKPTAGSAITTNAADLSGTYGKTHTQSYDKTGFHHGGVAGTPPPPFSLPLATATQAGQIGAPTAAAAFQPPYGVPMMAQPHSQMLHHHMQQDSTGGSSRAAAQTTAQPKTAGTKTYGATTYWGAN